MPLWDKNVCQFCAKRFINRSSCRRHEKNIHGKVYWKYKCIACEFSCSKKYELLEHNAANHTEVSEERPVQLQPMYLCQICKKRFASKNNCQRHEKHFHSILHLKYTCSRCEFSCSMNDELLEHIEVNHIEEHNQLPVQSSSTYSCPHCREIFDESVSLTNHNKSHATSRRPIPCSFCRKSFFSIRGCRSHENNFHINPKENVSNMQQNGISNSLSIENDFTEKQAIIKEKPLHETLENLKSSATSLIMSIIPKIQQYSEEQCEEFIKGLSVLKNKCEAIKSAENSEENLLPVAPQTFSSLSIITVPRVFLLRKIKNT